MVATIEEAFGTRTLKKKKCLKKETSKPKQFEYYPQSNKYNKGEYFDDNTNINSNSVYQDPQYYPNQRKLSRNNVPNIVLGGEDEPIKLAGIPIDMSGDGTPDDGEYAYAPGSEAEQEYRDYTGRPARPARQPVQFGHQEDDDDDDQHKEENIQQYIEEEGGQESLEGMIDYQSFELGVKKSIQDLTNKVNALLNKKGGLSDSSPLSNGADVILYIFTGIFFLFLFDMAVKIGARKR